MTSSQPRHTASAGGTRTGTIGVNTWVWTSPLTDANAPALLRHVADLGFDAVELPLEQLGDLRAELVAPILAETGLQPYVVGAMAPGRDLVDASEQTITDTQRYLRGCIDFAAAVGSPGVAGPFSAATGRVWPMTADQRESAYAQWRENLAPVVEHAAQHGVRLGIEPLNRYETSLINTVAQALEALDGLLGDSLGLALDSYHLNIEERDPCGAILAAAGHIAHVQVCGNDRGAPGPDHTDWPALLGALQRAGYDGPLVIESFTSDNAAIATAASIWRPLASSQDELASTGLAFLRTCWPAPTPSPRSESS